MNTGRHAVLFLMLVIVGVASVATCFGEMRSNPYTGIVDRNPFGLKPPPPPVLETNQEPAAPPPNVKLTGISNLFAKRALLEVTEQQAPARPGQPPQPNGNVNRPILAEGEAAFGVEVIAIDLDKNIVKIRNAGSESELTFEVPKPSGSGAPANVPMQVGRTANVPPAPGVGQPTIVSSAEPRGGVTMLGGDSRFAGNAGGVSTYGANPVATTSPSYGTTGGISTYGAPMMGNPSLAANPGLRTIPSRPTRIPTVSAPAPEIDPAVQAALILANQQQQAQPRPGRGNVSDPGPPPLPPIDHVLGGELNRGSGGGLPVLPNSGFSGGPQ